jgi:hypothetical protein
VRCYIGILDLHNNELFGELLSGIKFWKKLSELNLVNNDFLEKIPKKVGSLLGKKIARI